MHAAQAIADLSLELAAVTSTERALDIITRALRRSGLADATTIDDGQMHDLLAAIAIEGGAIQEIAEQLSVHGIGDAGIPPDGTSAA